jgi:hypothetical protein
MASQYPPISELELSATPEPARESPAGTGVEND